MKVVVLNRFFYPDTSATSQIASDLAFHLASVGHRVHAVCSSVSADEPQVEEVRGLQIHRVSRVPKAQDRLWKRMGAYAAFYGGARKALCRLVGPNDIVIAKTDPPLLSAAVAGLASSRGAHFVPWLQDVFPEVAQEYGIPGACGPSGALLRRIRDASLSKADRIVAIGDRMAQRIQRRPGVRPENVRVIHNWADACSVIPMEPSQSRLRQEWGLSDRFIVAYSGNLGRVHEFDTLLSAAKLLRDEGSILFAIIGRGPRLDEVRRRAERDSLSNVRFYPHQNREFLSESLAVGDLHIAVLRPAFEGLVQPSKLYGIMAAGRPTLFIGAHDSESGDILRAAQAGEVIQTGDAPALVRAIISLRDDQGLRGQMGRNARQALEQHYSMRLGLAKWEALLAELGSA